MSANSWSTSRLVSAEVGSSMTRIAGAEARERLRDLDHLPLRRGRAARRGVRGSMRHPEVGEQRRWPCVVQRAPVDDARPARRRRAEEDVLRHRQVRDEVELLVDDADAERERVARAVDRRRLAVEPDLAGVLAIRAAENLHQRRLAGAVLAEQHVHVAGVERQIDAVERDDARETPCGCRASRAPALPRSRSRDRDLEADAPPARDRSPAPASVSDRRPGTNRSSSMKTLLMRVSRTGRRTAAACRRRAAARRRCTRIARMSAARVPAGSGIGAAETAVARRCGTARTPRSDGVHVDAPDAGPRTRARRCRRRRSAST